MKNCYICHQSKDESEFHKNGKRGRGSSGRCKKCATLRSMQIKKNKRKQQFLEVVQLVGSSSCAICKREATDIDHDHSSGEVRGLLCKECNFGLGFLKDDPNLLRRAVEYLEKPNRYGQFWETPFRIYPKT